MQKVILGAIVTLLGVGNPVLAQSVIVPDGTLGNERSVVVPNFNNAPIEVITNGATRGQNLFHSFSQFNVGEGRSAYFILQDAALSNVFARVTGSNRSEISGTLGVAGSSANLFLINPNGILFGSSSSLDVGGSFIATTSNAIEFGDRGNFSATNLINPSPLLTVDPSAFLFTAIDRQAAIVNQSSVRGTTLLRGQPFFGLQVPNGQSLLLLGGDVQMAGGILQAPGGRVELGGLADVGSVGLAVNGGGLQLQLPEGVERSDVSLINSPLSFSGVSVAAGDKGDIAIKARNLDILNSILQAGIRSGLGTVRSQAGDITINVTGRFRLAGLGVGNTVQGRGRGNAGNITISAKTLNVTNGAQLNSSTFGQGDAGNLSITVRGAATFDGVGSNGFSSGALSSVASSGMGKGGTLTLNADTLNVTNGATLNSSTFGQGDAGNLSITVRDAATFDGVGSNGFSSDARSQVGANAVGKGGTLTLTAGTLSVTNGAQLDSSTGAQGNSGNVLITVQDIATFNGVGSNGRSSAAASQVDSGAVGKGGTVVLTVGTLNVINGAQLLSGTRGQGDAGSILITVRDAATFDGVDRDGFSSAVLSIVDSSSVGKGGTLTFNVGTLNVTNGATLNSSTFGQGDAGNLSITVRDAATFDGVGSNGVSSNARSRVASSAVGKGGTLTLNSGTLNVTNGAELSSSTFGRGDAGSLSITVRDAATFDGVGRNGFSSSAGSQVASSAVGKGGTLTLNAGTLNVTNGAVLSSSTFGQGDAGDIAITVSDAVTFDGMGRNGFPSSAGSTVESSGVGRGGTITLNSRFAQSHQWSGNDIQYLRSRECRRYRFASSRYTASLGWTYCHFLVVYRWREHRYRR